MVGIFIWTWNFWSGRAANKSKQQKVSASSVDFLSENDFEVDLTTFCCYDYGANSSEAVQKITAD